MAFEPWILVTTDDFDPGAEIGAVGGDPAVGAVASFVGYCRDEGGRLAALELEHYPGMAERQLDRIAREAAARWPLLAIRIVHRYGRLEPGARIVSVVTASSHRAAAFASCEFLMDYLKSRAPFWKKEHLRDGTSGAWVEAKDADETALKRWE
jgi:molybdopterin synthase catalytic subunit